MAKEKTDEQIKKELLSDLQKLIKTANQRILRVERAFGKDRWGVKNLRDRLDTLKLNAWTTAGRIRANKSMTLTQLRAIEKVTKDFLKNVATTTISGIKETREKQIKGLQKSLRVKDRELTFDEAEFFYRLFDDTDYRFFIEHYNFPASAFDAFIQEAIDNRQTFSRFVDSLEVYIEIGNDEELLTRARAIYEKYVLSME